MIADQPDDLVINTHVCRGNFHSTWLSSGGYAPVAAKLFGEENVDAYYLEFDDDRSGDFAPLAEVSGDKKVVLGLITSKKPDLEDPDTIKARIQEAAQYIPLDRLCLSTQCGFASTQEGNKLTEDQPRSHSSNPSPRTCGASKHSTPSTISYKEGLSVLFGG